MQQCAVRDSVLSDMVAVKSAFPVNRLASHREAAAGPQPASGFSGPVRIEFSHAETLSIGSCTARRPDLCRGKIPAAAHFLKRQIDGEAPGTFSSRCCPPPPGHSALTGGTVQLRALPGCIVQGALPVVAALRAAEFDLGGGRESNPIRRNRILSGLIAAQPPGSVVLIAPDVKGIRQPRSSGYVPVPGSAGTAPDCCCSSGV